MGKGSVRRPGTGYESHYDRVFRQAREGGATMTESRLAAERADRGFEAPAPSKGFGFVVTDPDSFGTAAHRRPSALEQLCIDEYRRVYKEAFKQAPEGIHVLPCEHGIAVFLPTES
jgi:hypothetical protein